MIAGVSCGSGASARGGPLAACNGARRRDGKLVYAAVSDLRPRLVTRQPLVPIRTRAVACTRSGRHRGRAWTAPAAKRARPARTAAPRNRPRLRRRRTTSSRGRSMVTPRLRNRRWRTAVGLRYGQAVCYVNGVAANGGSLDAGGPTIAGGMIFVNSGYGLYGGQPGNVLLAFAPRP